MTMHDATFAPPDSSDTLRLRLLVALGLGASTLSGCWVSKCENATQTITVSLDALAGDSGDTSPDTAVALEDCPTESQAAAELIYAAGEYCGVVDPTLVSQSDSDCTYEYACQVCCGYGRPFLDATGAPALAGTAPSTAWAREPGAPGVAALDPAERQAIGAYWLQNARAEHSSVAGFNRFVLDLLSHGAPPELIARAQAAASQELQHALDCFRLASAYLGRPVGPGPLDMGGHAVIAKSVAELAAWTARDGAVGETLAAYLAGRALADTTDVAVRAVLERIVRDETEHAELAWATIQWAVETGGPEVREAVGAVFANLGEPVAHAGAWAPRFASHGVPCPSDETRAAARCIAQVILPVADALLGSAAPTRPLAQAAAEGLQA